MAEREFCPLSIWEGAPGPSPDTKRANLACGHMDNFFIRLKICVNLKMHERPAFRPEKMDNVLKILKNELLPEQYLAGDYNYTPKTVI